MAPSWGRQKQFEKHGRDVPMNIFSSETCHLSMREEEREQGGMFEAGLVRANVELDVKISSPEPGTERALHLGVFTGGLLCGPGD